MTLLNKPFASTLLICAQFLAINTAVAAPIKPIRQYATSIKKEALEQVRGPLSLDCSYALETGNYSKVNAIEHNKFSGTEDGACSELSFRSDFLVTIVQHTSVSEDSPSYNIANTASVALRFCQRQPNKPIIFTQAFWNGAQRSVWHTSNSLELTSLMGSPNVRLVSECPVRLSNKK